MDHLNEEELLGHCQKITKQIGRTHDIYIFLEYKPVLLQVPAITSVIRVPFMPLVSDRPVIIPSKSAPKQKQSRYSVQTGEHGKPRIPNGSIEPKNQTS